VAGLAGGHQPAEPTKRSGAPINCCQRPAALSLAATVVLKFMIGRSQVYPPFLRDGIYTFLLVHGRPDYGAFPSATMAGASALIIGLHLRTAAERVTLVVVTSLLTAALLVTNGHWMSDIIGGVCLGLVIGRAVARRFFES